MRPKLTKIIIVLLLGIVCLWVIFLVRKQTSPLSPPDPEQAEPLPIVPAESNQTQTTYRSTDQQPDLSPTSVHTYTVTNDFDPVAYVHTLQFTDDQLVSTRTTPERTMWESPEAGQITIINSPNWYIFYQAPTATASPAATPPSLDQIYSQAETLINTYFQPYSPYPLKVDGIEYLKSSGNSSVPVTNPKQATTIKITLYAEFDSLSLYTNTRPLNVGDLRLTLDGRLINFTFSVPPQATQEQEVLPLSKTDAFNLLKQGKGTLILAAPNKPTELSFKPDLSSVVVERTSLIYLYLPDQRRIIPTYLLTGKANSGSDALKFNVAYLVPAI